MLTIIMVVAVVLAAFWVLKPKKIEKDVENFVTEEVKKETSAPEKIEIEIAEVFPESLEELKERLENLINIDSEKPFAKISTPALSEVPVELLEKASDADLAPSLESISESPSPVEPVKPAIKAKVKPKAKPVEKTEAKVESKVEAKPKRTYTKKKDNENS